MKHVALWIYTGVVMLLIQVILGGVTRLTGSGLSITEWNIVTGTLPPLSPGQWLAEFNKYRQTPQYLLLNTDFTLADFKFIFFWEWFHRLWARMIAVVFLIPFIFFLIRRSFRREMIIPLIILFLLGALQGAVGWIMVASGLVGDAVYVRPTRLALHFVFALGLIAYAYWFALQLSVPSTETMRNKSLSRSAIIICFVLFFQLVYGALMAGHKAAASAPTFPRINDNWIPPNMFRYHPAVINLIENKITIHFVHRGLAWLLLISTLIFSYQAIKATNLTAAFRKTRWIPLALIVLQFVLGIITVLSSTSVIPNQWGLFHWMAELHQVTGMLFLLVVIRLIYITLPGKSYI